MRPEDVARFNAALEADEARLEGYQERLPALEAALTARVAAHMAANHPGVAYSLEVFDSDNGDDDWLEPVAASLKVPALGVNDAYGLCDAGSSTVDGQADYLLEQILEELAPYIKRAGR